MEIIPAIDLIDGKCVRLTQGDYSRKTVYNENPLEVAKSFEAAGLRRLHLVDLDGAKAGSVQNWAVLEDLTAHTGLAIDFGGGVKSESDVERLFSSGAALATIGSMAIRHPYIVQSWMEKFGAERFLLGADVHGESIAISGWQETTAVSVFDFIGGYLRKGIRQVFCTDVARDGLLAGPSVELYRRILERFPDLHFIASGGVSGMDDLKELSAIGCKGAIVGKAIYECNITLEELSTWH